MNNVTVIILTFNEEKHIENAIKSAKWASKVIVLDSCSTDSTKLKAQQMGAEVFQREFDNFSSQKNFALTLSTTKWVFFLDADERFTRELEREVKVILNSPKHVAYMVMFDHYFMGKKINYSGWASDSTTRLVNKEFCKFEGDVHEKIVTKQSIGKLHNKIRHYTYKNIKSHITKYNNYAFIAGKEKAKMRKKVTFFDVSARPAFRFFKHFIIQKGFLDGSAGYHIAVQEAITVYYKYLIAKRLQVELTEGV